MKRLETLALLDAPFRVARIVDVPAPDGSGSTWQQYVISQGGNTITGLRPGPRLEVASELDQMVERLNQRRMGKKPK